MGIYPKDAQLYHKDVCSTMFTAALFVIAEPGNNLNAPRLKNNKEEVIHLHNGVLHSGKNDILKFVGKWMDLENMILSEVTQTQNDKYNMNSFISGF